MENEDGLAFFDIDGTFYRDSLNIAIIDRLAKDGLIPQSRLCELRRARRVWKERDGTYTDYIHLLVKSMENGLLTGIPEKDYCRVSRQVVRALGKRVYLFTRELHAALRGHGYATVALSGSPDQSVSAFARRWGFSDFVATRFTLDARGCLVSAKSHIDVPAERKGKEFKRLCEVYGAHPYETLAIGDTAGDAPMLNEAEFPIAFNPDQELEKIAWEKSWPIVIERKNTITILKRESRRKVETIMPRPVALALRERLAVHGITLRP